MTAVRSHVDASVPGPLRRRRTRKARERYILLGVIVLAIVYPIFYRALESALAVHPLAGHGRPDHLRARSRSSRSASTS